MSLATPSSPSSVGSRDEYGADMPSSPSWAGDAVSGGEESDAAMSSDDGQDAAPYLPQSPRPKIKLKRGTPALHDTGFDVESQGESEPVTTPSASVHLDTVPASVDPATGAKRKRPIKQLRAKPLRVALESLIAAFKK